MKRRGISRRTFLSVAGAAPAAASLVSSFGSGTTAAAKPLSPSGKLKFGCMVTFEDWTSGAGTWGEVGVRYILRRLKDTGFYRVYWRTSGSGQASYPSKVATPISFWEPYDPVKYPEHLMYFAKKSGAYFGVSTESGNWGYGRDPALGSQAIDFSNFDSVAIARDMCRRLGLEFWLWHEQAEDHGGLGQIGRMGLRHPEWFTLNRDGKRSRCRFSFAIPEAMDYRLAWVRELLEYEPDGLYFDFTKSMEGTPGVGATPHFDDDGVWYCTYDKPAVEAFKKKTGRDPHKIPNGDEEWVRFRASYLRDFVRRVRDLQRSTYPKVKVGLFGCPNGRAGLAPSDKVVPLADPLRANLEDHDTWTREGLIDEFVNAYTNQVDQKNPASIKATIADSRARVHAPCRYRGSQIETYWAKDEKAILAMVEALAETGCEEVVFFESTPLQWNNTWDAAYKAIKQFGS